MKNIYLKVGRKLGITFSDNMKFEVKEAESFRWCWIYGDQICNGKVTEIRVGLGLETGLPKDSQPKVKMKQFLHLI